jgi:hypothetical protein
MKAANDLGAGAKAEETVVPTDFVPLHSYSWYSVLEGVDAPDRLLQRAPSAATPPWP